MRIRGPFAYLLFVVAGAGLLAAAAPSHQDHWLAPSPVAAAGSMQPVPDLTGQWVGSWADTVYLVGGTMAMTINRDGDSWFASGTIDVSAISPPLGILGGSATGTSNATTLAGNFQCLDLGNGSFSIVAPLAVGEFATATGSGSVGPPLGFGPFTFEGSLTGEAMVGTFDFTNPTGGKGIAAMVKFVDAVTPESMSAVKSKYRP